MTFSSWMTWLVFFGFLIDWSAIAFNWRKIKIFSKSLAMLLVILWTLVAAAGQFNLVIYILLLGQVFGLIGDILLQFPRRWFLFGLGAFLLGHLSYLILLIVQIICAFNTSICFQCLVWWSLLCLVLWLGVLVVFYRIFSPYSKGETYKPLIWAAVQIYAWILSLIVALAFLLVFLLPGRSPYQWLLPVGSILFSISDILLSYNRFIKRIRHGQLLVRITYHLAQLCLAGGFLVIIF